MTRSIFFAVLMVGPVLASHSADFNSDGRVDQADLEIMKNQWRGSGTADLDHNNIVDARDAGKLFSSWGVTTPPPPPTGTRDPFLWPFASNSPWNMPIGSGAQYVDAVTPIGSGPNAFGWPNGWGTPMFVSPSPQIRVYRNLATDPIRNIWSRIMWQGQPHSGDFIMATGIRVSDSVSDADFRSHWADGPAVLIDPDGRTAYNLFAMLRMPSGDLSVHGPGLTADDMITGDGWAPFTNTLTPPAGQNPGARASGGSLLGGMIRKGELYPSVPGEGIRHALVAIVQWQWIRNQHVWPATYSDGNNTTGIGNIYEGTLLAIPPTVDITQISGVGTSGPAYELARALQDYGAYVGDSGDNVQLGIDAFALSPQSPQSLGDIPWDWYNDSGGVANANNVLWRLCKELRVVANNGPSSVGGGGTPRRPLAPPFAP